jgi:16S rRNA (uracil1498-N3)-methyltransferase
MKNHNIFYVPYELFRDNEAVIQGSELHHIRNVLRKKEGEQITLTDGQGNLYQAEICRNDQFKMVARILKKEHHSRTHSLEITLGFVPVKGLRNDVVIEKGTEIGVWRFIIFSSEYAMVRDFGTQKIERFKKIARSAMVQSQRYYLPEIVRAKHITEMLQLCNGYDMIVVADPCGKADVSLGASKMLLVIGPEGGFSETETNFLVNQGAVLLGLGTTRLRSETAAIVGISKILAAYGQI